MNWTDFILDILNSYRLHIDAVHEEKALKRFNNRYNNNQESALSEAIIFNWLKSCDLNPHIAEDPGKGGADFICHLDNNKNFIVEVTCLGCDALTKASNVPNELQYPNQMLFPKIPTQMVKQVVVAKTNQLAGYDMPRVLAITTLHNFGYMLLGHDHANNFFVSDWAWSFPIGGKEEDITRSTDLKKSVFFRRNKNNPNEIEPCRQSVSAILLVPISGNLLSVTGILHPKPEYHFDIQNLPDVPFITVEPWPLEDMTVHTKWLVARLSEDSKLYIEKSDSPLNGKSFPFFPRLDN